MVLLRSRNRRAGSLDDRRASSLDFESWARDAHPQLRQALTAAFGPEVADDSANEALAIAWEQWPVLSLRPNPMAYTFGIARNRARRHARQPKQRFPAVEPAQLPHVEPGLPAAIETLSERQRTVIGLVHGYGWSLAEVAEVLGLSKSSVQNHNERGMARLRTALGVSS